jgi:hypothetical protein
LRSAAEVEAERGGQLVLRSRSEAEQSPQLKEEGVGVGEATPVVGEAATKSAGEAASLRKSAGEAASSRAVAKRRSPSIGAGRSAKTPSARAKMPKSLGLRCPGSKEACLAAIRAGSFVVGLSSVGHRFLGDYLPGTPADDQKFLDILRERGPMRNERIVRLFELLDIEPDVVVDCTGMVDPGARSTHLGFHFEVQRRFWEANGPQIRNEMRNFARNMLAEFVSGGSEFYCVAWCPRRGPAAAAARASTWPVFNLSEVSISSLRVPLLAWLV